MDSITIGGNSYPSYSTQANADQYLAAAIWATDWNAPASDTSKGQGLVTATRWFDEVAWATGYDTQDLRYAVAAIQNACIELAAMLVANPTLRDDMQQPQTPKLLKADTVTIENFRPENVTVDSIFPRRIMDQVGAYLDSSAVLTGSMTFGTDNTTVFDDTYDVRLQP